MNIAIVGGGPAGFAAGILASNSNNRVVIFEKNPEVLKKLLLTGNGKCNYRNANQSLDKYHTTYPDIAAIINPTNLKLVSDFWNNLGIIPIIKNGYYYPFSEKASSMKSALLKKSEDLGITIKYHTEITNIEYKENKFLVQTSNFTETFDKVIIATGGHASYDIAKSFGHTVIEPKKSLVGLITEAYVSELAGVSLQCGGENVLFTHKGVSGPYIYRISSLKARDKFPYKLSFDFVGKIDFQNMLNLNPHKSVKNLVSELVPKSFAEFILKKADVSLDEKCHKIDGKTRDKILEELQNFTVTITGTDNTGEVVTCGGVALDGVNSKTMESKLINGLYFIGEVLDIDGFCGGFNLQNCWSTAFVAACGVKSALSV